MPYANFSVTQTTLNPENPTNLPRPPQLLKMEEGQRLKLQWDQKDFFVSLKKVEINKIILFTDTLLVNKTNNTGNVLATQVEFELKLKDSAILATPAFGKGSLWELRLEEISLSEAKTTPEPAALPIKPAPEVKEPTPNQAVKPINPPPPQGQIKIRIPKINWRSTQEIISQVEEKLGGKVITYYTSPPQEIMDQHTEMFIDHLNKQAATEESLYLVLVSYGGSITAALRISSLLREYFKNVNILVPSRCASAATVISLSGDKIYLSPSGFLTAIDSSSTHPLNPKGADGKVVSVSVDQLRRILKFLGDEEGSATDESGHPEGSYRTLFKYIHPIAAAQIDRSSSLSELVATKVMKFHSHSFASEERIKAIAAHLVNSYPSHSFPILYSEAKEIGLPVEQMDKEVSDLLWDLVKLYDATSNLVTTHRSQDFYHVEELPVIIESKDKRTMRRLSMDKRFNPMTRTWGTENNNTNWINLKPSEVPGREFEISTLDVIEKNPES